MRRPVILQMEDDWPQGRHAGATRSAARLLPAIIQAMQEANRTETSVSHNVDAIAFIERWQGVTASKLSTAQSFVTQLCELLGIEAPHPTPEQNYMFERPITFSHGDGSSSAGRIDCYRRGHFVLEAKKLKAASHTKGFDDALLRARAQAEGYALTPYDPALEEEIAAGRAFMRDFRDTFHQLAK